MDDHTRTLFRTEAESDRFLVGCDKSIDLWMRTCPRAKTLEGWSETLDAWVIVANTCNNWSCPVCGRRKVQHYAQKVAKAEPNRLITLTVNPSRHSSPREAFDSTRRKVTELATKLRRRYDEFEFFRVLEVTKKGWPHYHLITRSPYIPQPEISDLWNGLTGAPIVDVRQMKKTVQAYWYVVKYLAKQKYIPWTDRRAAWTRKFFKKVDFVPGPKLNILVPHFANAHPADHARWCYEGSYLERYSDNCWVKRGRPADE